MWPVEFSTYAEYSLECINVKDTRYEASLLEFGG